MSKGRIVVSPITVNDLKFRIPKFLTNSLMKKMLLPTDVTYLQPYAEIGSVFLVTLDNEPIGCFIAFLHQGRDLTNKQSLALTVLSLASKRRYKSTVIAAAIKFASILGCSDFHYYEEPNTRVKLSPFMNIAARPAKHFYCFQVQNLYLPFDFIYADAAGNVLWEQSTSEQVTVTAPPISGTELKTERETAESEVDLEGEFSIGDTISEIIDKLGDYEVESVNDDEWSTNLPLEAFENETEEEGELDDGFEFEEDN